MEFGWLKYIHALLYLLYELEDRVKNIIQLFFHIQKVKRRCQSLMELRMNESFEFEIPFVCTGMMVEDALDNSDFHFFPVTGPSTEIRFRRPLWDGTDGPRITMQRMYIEEMISIIEDNEIEEMIKELKIIQEVSSWANDFLSSKKNIYGKSKEELAKLLMKALKGSTIRERLNLDELFSGIEKLDIKKSGLFKFLIRHLKDYHRMTIDKVFRKCRARCKGEVEKKIKGNLSTPMFEFHDFMTLLDSPEDNMNCLFGEIALKTLPNLLSFQLFRLLKTYWEFVAQLMSVQPNEIINIEGLRAHIIAWENRTFDELNCFIHQVLGHFIKGEKRTITMLKIHEVLMLRKIKFFLLPLDGDRTPLDMKRDLNGQIPFKKLLRMENELKQNVKGERKFDVTMSSILLQIQKMLNGFPNGLQPSFFCMKYKRMDEISASKIKNRKLNLLSYLKEVRRTRKLKRKERIDDVDESLQPKKKKRKLNVNVRPMINTIDNQ